MKTEDLERVDAYESDARKFAKNLSNSLGELVYIVYCNRANKYYTSTKKTSHSFETLVACYDLGEEREID
jgi:hypothetical protein